MGSGTTPQDINQLLAQFNEMRTMMRQISSGKGPWAKMARQYAGAGGLPGMSDMPGMGGMGDMGGLGGQSAMRAPALSRPAGSGKKTGKAARKEKRKQKQRQRAKSRR